MEEKTFEQLNRVFETLCTALRSGYCGSNTPENRCPCFNMNCCNKPEFEVTKQDLIDGIRVLQKALSGNEEE